MQLTSYSVCWRLCRICLTIFSHFLTFIDKKFIFIVCFDVEWYRIFDNEILFYWTQGYSVKQLIRAVFKLSVEKNLSISRIPSGRSLITIHWRKEAAYILSLKTPLCAATFNGSIQMQSRRESTMREFKNIFGKLLICREMSDLSWTTAAGDALHGAPTCDLVQMRNREP